MNYYTTFTTGIIDGLLLNTLANEYCYKVDKEALRKDAPYYYSTMKKAYVQRNNIISDTAENRGTRNDRSNAFGRKEVPVENHLRTYLIKKTGEYRAIIEDKFDYEEEYKSPFESSINRMLLIFKWISGIQSITKNTAVIKQSDIDQIGLNVKLGALKASFEKMFEKQIVTSTQSNDEWRIKIGGNALNTGMGPGFIKLRIQIPALIESIHTYHKDLQCSLKVE